jgi:hypothetical protein
MEPGRPPSPPLGAGIVGTSASRPNPAEPESRGWQGLRTPGFGSSPGSQGANYPLPGVRGPKPLPSCARSRASGTKAVDRAGASASGSVAITVAHAEPASSQQAGADSGGETIVRADARRRVCRPGADRKCFCRAPQFPQLGSLHAPARTGHAAGSARSSRATKRPARQSALRALGRDQGRAHGARGVSGGQRPRRHVPRDDAPGGDDRPTADGHPGSTMTPCASQMSSPPRIDPWSSKQPARDPGCASNAGTSATRPSRPRRRTTHRRWSLPARR